MIRHQALCIGFTQNISSSSLANRKPVSASAPSPPRHPLTPPPQISPAYSNPFLQYQADATPVAFSSHFSQAASPHRKPSLAALASWYGTVSAPWAQTGHFCFPQLMESLVLFSWWCNILCAVRLCRRRGRGGGLGRDISRRRVGAGCVPSCGGGGGCSE